MPERDDFEFEYDNDAEEIIDLLQDENPDADPVVKGKTNCKGCLKPELKR